MIEPDPLLARLAELRLGKYGVMCVRAWLSKHPEGAIRDAIETMHKLRERGYRFRDPTAWVSKRLAARLQTLTAVRSMRDAAAARLEVGS